MNTVYSRSSFSKGRNRVGFVRVKNFMIVSAIFFAIVGSASAADVDFPKKPIHIWLGFSPGSVSDSVIRKMAPTAEKILGQSLVMESKAGAAGARALELLKSAEPDGYTLVGSTTQGLTHVPHMTHVKYDPFGDFTPLILTYTMANGVVVKSDSPFKTFQDLIGYARKNPGTLTIGLPGAGTEPHLTMVRIAQQEKVKFQYVQFMGSVPTITAILGGHVGAVALLDARYMPHVKAGTLRVLLSLNPEGLEGYPAVPTLSQFGYDLPAFANGMLIAPKGVPKPITDKLVAAFEEAKKTPDFQSFASEHYLTIPHPVTTSDLLKELRARFDKTGPIIDLIGLTKK